MVTAGQSLERDRGGPRGTGYRGGDVLVPHPLGGDPCCPGCSAWLHVGEGGKLLCSSPPGQPETEGSVPVDRENQFKRNSNLSNEQTTKLDIWKVSRHLLWPAKCLILSTYFYSFLKLETKLCRNELFTTSDN